MATFQLSESEREYIVNGIREDLRADGRMCTDYRNFTIRAGVVSNTSGSAKIDMVRGRRHVLAAYSIVLYSL